MAIRSSLSNARRRTRNGQSEERQGGAQLQVRLHYELPLQPLHLQGLQLLSICRHAPSAGVEGAIRRRRNLS